MSVHLDHGIYLDNAATSFPKPDVVYSTVDQWMRRAGVAYGRGNHSGTLSTDRMVQETRHAIAKLLNAETADRIAFTFNCTDSLHLLLRGIVKQGDKVVSTTLDHNSVLRPLHQLAIEKDASIDRIEYDRETGLINVDQFVTLVNKQQPRIVILNHASNVTGVVQPIQELTEIAHQAGAFVILDAAQTVGHFPVNLQALKIDYMAAAGHKGLLGPLGTGMIYVAPDMEHQLAAVRTGGSGQQSDSIEHPSRMPARLESGNMNVPGIAGLWASVHWLQDETVEAVHERIRDLELRLLSGLSTIKEVRIHCRPAHTNEDQQGWPQTTGTVSISIGETDCREVSVILDQSFGIQTRAGLHCAPLAHQQLETFDNGGTVRISPGPFNTVQEIDETIEAIRQVAESLSFT
ncbi:MAG: aminotransferase class V-fold PLP-dependent enzyme [Fuerstiella sp.]